MNALKNKVINLIKVLELRANKNNQSFDYKVAIKECISDLRFILKNK